MRDATRPFYRLILAYLHQAQALHGAATTKAIAFAGGVTSMMMSGFDLYDACSRSCSRSRGLRAGFALATALVASACANDAQPSDADQQSEALVSRPKVLASHQANPGALALDASSVYWTTFGSSASEGSIVKVSKQGDTPVTLADHQSVPFGIAVDDTQVYWANYDAGGPNGALMAVPKRGGTPKVLVATADGPRSVVVDATRAYFLTASALIAVAKHGGAPITVTPTQCGSSIAADDASLYWVVNCVMFPPQGIFKVSKAGGIAAKISDEAPNELVIASDGIYWIATGGNVMKLPKTGGVASIVATFASQWSAPLAVDTLGFYAGIDSNVVKRSRFFAGSTKTVASGPAPVGALAIDGTSVYWSAQQDDGRIFKASKY
jgi:hypothetical protein